MLQQFAYQGAAAPKCPAEDALLYEMIAEDDTQPSSIILEEEDDDKMSVALTTTTIVDEHERDWQEAVPSSAPSCTILEFAEHVSRMKPRDCHAPFTRCVTAHLTQVGLSAHSVRYECPNCHQRRYSYDSDDEERKCYACRTTYLAHEAVPFIEFPLSLMDATGELYNLRIRSPVADKLVTCSELQEARGALVFSKWRLELRAAWNESLRRPLVQILDAARVGAN